MPIGKKIFTRLSNYAGLKALVSSRIYPAINPQAVTYPSVTYEKVGGYREVAMGADPGICRASYQMTAWSESYNITKGVANQIRLAIERWQDEAGSNVLDCFLEDEIDEFVPDVRVYACTQQFEVIYRE